MSGLPFQQINPRQESGQSDTLYQQRRAERSSLETQYMNQQNPQSSTNQPSAGFQQQFQIQSQQPQFPQPSPFQNQNQNQLTFPIPSQPQNPIQPQQQMQPQQQIQQMQPQQPIQQQSIQRQPQSSMYQVPQMFQPIPAMKQILSPPTVKLPPGTPPPNNTVISTFLSLDAATQQRFATMNPTAYAQLYVAITGDATTVASTTVAKQKKKHVKSQRVPDPISESDNFHSSDEELNVRPDKQLVHISAPHHNQHQSHPEHQSHQAHQKTKHQQYKHIPIDFRNNLIDVNEHFYTLLVPPCQINEIELESCIINRTELLEREPYIYISIKEIPGDHQLIGDSKMTFGKLVQEKITNEFIFYRTENCRKVLSTPMDINNLTVSFLNYDQSPISIGKLNVKELSNGKNYCKFRTKGAHYLNSGDSVNISYRANNRVTVDSLIIIDIPNEDTIITEPSVYPIVPEDKCTFERTQIKCSLSLKVSYN